MILARTLAVTLAVLAFDGAATAAGIVCREGYQRIDGREISTHYCNDNYVAEVARQYGIKVTDAAVRNNPARKDEICRHIGHDIRIMHYCDIDSGPDRSR